MFLVGKQTLSGDGKAMPVSFVVFDVHSPGFMDEHGLLRPAVEPTGLSSLVPGQVARNGDALPRATANAESMASEWILLVNTIVPVGAL